MPNKHLPLVPRCGACADEILKYEVVVALLGNDDSTACAERSRPFPFPKHGYPTELVDGRWPCRRSVCDDCAIAPEAVALHYDCFRIFEVWSRQSSSLEGQEALDRLWTLASARNPWPRARLLHLDETTVDVAALPRMAGVVGLPQLCQVPREILVMIQRLCPHELLWRSLSVIAFASQVPMRLPRSTVPLRQVLPWSRGEPLTASASDSEMLPYITIVMDRRGIREIYRRKERPPYTGQTSTSLAFIVVHMGDCASMSIGARDGLARLQSSGRLLTPRIWNTDAPPISCRSLDPSSWSLAGPGVCQLFAFDIHSARGITFFFTAGELYGVHVHCSPSSSAAVQYERLREVKRQAVWIYMPIGLGDRATVLACRRTNRGFNMLVRMERAGEIILGQLGRRVHRDCLLAYGPRLTFVYGEPLEMQRVPLIGAYSSACGKVALPPYFAAPHLEPDTDEIYFSWAPLDAIESIRVFRDELGLCRGMILRYENGGLRAVGQCRLHLDESVLAIKPSALCYRPTTYTVSKWGWRRPGVLVELAAEAAHAHKSSDWECIPLAGGTLIFSFTEDASYVSYRDHWP
ncbi:hypothetical protein VTK73DRAFT_10163 [Phialemonium thermophilum]|uniref:F-box domain-containing protein n=1 Tax=Phialemonium thermophilum TaxID=223376 RepID=A0ABR3VY75_9PEZI